MENFILHSRLKNDTIEVIDLKLCRVLLMNDASFPWLILVPMRPGVTEIYELSKDDRMALMDEAAAASRAINRAFTVDKINSARSETLSLSSMCMSWAEGQTTAHGPALSGGAAQPRSIPREPSSTPVSFCCKPSVMNSPLKQLPPLLDIPGSDNRI